VTGFKTLREQTWEANRQLPKLGLVLFTFGNVSIIDRQHGIIAIKPSGVPYDHLTSEDIVILDLEGTRVEGTLRPSSDTKTHLVLYHHWPTIGAIVHTHSTYATAWAQSLQDIPILGTTHADHATTDIPCAPPMKDEYIQGDYEHMTGLQIVEELKARHLSPTELEMILVGNHAPFTWGKDAAKALYNSAVLESIAQMAYLTLSIDPQASRMKESLIRKHHERKHGPHSYYGQ
jgi:L-ribulose-5-phosphate 4-epimerase